MRLRKGIQKRKFAHRVKRLARFHRIIYPSMSKKRKLEISEASRETAHKKSRHYSEQDRKLASIYDGLADESNDVRIKAAKELLLELQPQRISEKDNLVEIALKRLIRGLCSGRKAARFGFFIALTELLRAVYGEDSQYNEDNIPQFEKILELIESLTQPESNVAGQVSTFTCLINTVKCANRSIGEKRSHFRPRICIQSPSPISHSNPLPSEGDAV